MARKRQRSFGTGFKNSNGNFTLHEFIKMKMNNQIEDYMRNFKITESKCPPKELCEGDCFRCMSCFKHADKLIVIQKRNVKIRNKKIKIEEFLDEDKTVENQGNMERCSKCGKNNDK